MIIRVHIRAAAKAVATVMMVTGLLLAGGPVHAEPKSADTSFLSEHTLIYPNRDGKEELIHFGRFGNFDWYYPCTIESGSWSLDADNVLSLTYDNTDFAPRSYRLAQKDGGVQMIESDRTTQAFIASGNLLPYT